MHEMTTVQISSNQPINTNGNKTTKSSKDSQKANVLGVTRMEDYSKWYLEVIKEADLADNSPVRGCMVIKPWGYGIWENIQKKLNEKFQALGIENAYFPIFIPLSFFTKESNHVAGFAKECAVVTHYRLENNNGQIGLDPDALLGEPLIVRPTSETIIGYSFQKWIRSYKDLPLRINQWANVVRWEHETRPFLRTTEFLWQEGHTAHATGKETLEQAKEIAFLYRNFIQNELAIPVILGEKSPGERFAGAENSFTFEAMMQDGKALQAGTSHYLGQNFSKSFDIKFFDDKQASQYVYTTSWGLTTRLIGALIMVHSDDNGLRLPPCMAKNQIVIIPIIRKQHKETEIYQYAEKIARSIRKLSYKKSPISVLIDKSEESPANKNWHWIKKGVPIRIEMGARELDSDFIEISRRDQPNKEKQQLPLENVAKDVKAVLKEIQKNYYNEAEKYRNERIRKDILTFEDLKVYFSKEKSPGFVLAKWCGSQESEERLKELKITIRCLPLEQTKIQGRCVITGEPADIDAIFARSY